MSQTREFVRKKLQESDFELLRGPLIVLVHFRIPVAVSSKRYIRVKQHQSPHTFRPDGDNLEKFLNDALNGILWQDDCKISWLIRSKTRTIDEIGSTTIAVQEIDSTSTDYEQLLAFINEHIYLEKTA